jgi:hypothetical protein
MIAYDVAVPAAVTCTNAAGSPSFLHASGIRCGHVQGVRRTVGGVRWDTSKVSAGRSVGVRSDAAPGERTATVITCSRTLELGS